MTPRDAVDPIGWLARQPPGRIALLAAAWAVGLPAVALVAFRLTTWYLVWRHGAVAFGVQLKWPGVALILLVPPAVLVVAWSAARRAR